MHLVGDGLVFALTIIVGFPFGSNEVSLSFLMVNLARSRVMARLNWVSQGQRCGRCRVRRRAERVSRPGQGEEPTPEGLGGHYLLAQAKPGRPAGEVMRQHLYRQPGGVGGEAPRGEMVQPYAVLQVSNGVLDLGVAAVVGLQFPGSLRPGR